MPVRGVILLYNTFQRAEEITWLFIQKLSRDHSLEVNGGRYSSPSRTTEITNAWEFEATFSKIIELHNLVLRYGNKFTFASG